MDMKKLIKIITSKHFRQTLKEILFYLIFFALVILFYLKASDYIFNKFNGAMEAPTDQAPAMGMEKTHPQGPSINTSGITIRPAEPSYALNTPS